LVFSNVYLNKKRQTRKNQRGNKEWTIQRRPKGQSRMDNPEKTKGAIKNGQARENQRGNQEWTIQRKPKGQSRMDNPEKTKGAIKNGQSRQNQRGCKTFSNTIYYTGAYEIRKILAKPVAVIVSSG
jgi:hypothetical protein